MEAAELMGSFHNLVARQAGIVLRWRLFLRNCFVARGNFSGDRLARTDGLSPAKWTFSFGIAHLERTLRPPDQNGFVHDLGKGAQSLLEHVWEDC